MLQSPKMSHPRCLPVGEAAFTIEFGDLIRPALNRKVHILDRLLNEAAVSPEASRIAAAAGIGIASLEGIAEAIVETVPTYCALLVIFEPHRISADRLRDILVALARAIPDAPAAEAGRTVTVPVRYGGEDGPDLAAVAAHTGLTPEQIIRRHAGATYTVAMLGFAPGFAYLLGLPPELAAPRLPTPRLHVPPGSVGIAGEQTGVYTIGTPGGWCIIGRTPLPLFDPAEVEPFRLSTGDRVRFVPLPAPAGEQKRVELDRRRPVVALWHRIRSRITRLNRADGH